MKLGDFATVKTAMPRADFWLVRKGAQHTVGKPTREYNAEHIGILVTRTGALDPKFLYYLLEHLHGRGYWIPKSHGTLKLVSIRATDVKEIAFEGRTP